MKINKENYMKIVIVGLGGVGSVLCDNLARYLNYSDIEASVSLVDGDYYESKNSERQTFIRLGDKASVKCTELTHKFSDVSFIDFNNFVNEDNVSSIIEDGSIVFLCVDNHISRKVISDYCSTLSDITIISGGNEYTDGNVQIFKREGGKNVTAALTEYHPEIEYAEDQSPEDMSCEELSKSDPQLLFTNLTVATIMCWMFYAIHTGKDVTKHGEVYFDIITMATLAKTRNSKL
jgi:molybdopterin/thiamine biosynthesis adenylyltransferase